MLKIARCSLMAWFRCRRLHKGRRLLFVGSELRSCSPVVPCHEAVSEGLVAQRQQCAEGHLVDTSLKCLSCDSFSAARRQLPFSSGRGVPSLFCLQALGSSVLRGLLLSTPPSCGRAEAPFGCSRGAAGSLEPACPGTAGTPLLEGTAPRPQQLSLWGHNGSQELLTRKPPSVKSCLDSFSLV